MVEPITALDLFFFILGLVVLVIITGGFQKRIRDKYGDSSDNY